MQAALDTIKEAEFFTIIDMKSGFWQIKVDEASQRFVAIITHRGVFRCKTMPFGYDDVRVLLYIRVIVAGLASAFPATS